MDGQRRHTELEAELVAKDQLIAELKGELQARDARIARIEQQLAVLSEKLAENSGNSNLPPSSDPPGKRTGDKAKKLNRNKGRKRKRGGQKGR